MRITELLGSNSYLIVNKRLVRALGVECAYVLSLLCSYSVIFNSDEFFRTYEDMTEDTQMSEYELRKSIKKLITYGLLKVERKGLPAKNFFTIKSDVLEKFIDGRSAFEIVGNVLNNELKQGSIFDKR